jgi:hypothetical protein
MALNGAADKEGWWVGVWDGSVTVIYVIVNATLIKKKIKFSSYLGKFRVEQLQSHRAS